MSTLVRFLDSENTIPVPTSWVDCSPGACRNPLEQPVQLHTASELHQSPGVDRQVEGVEILRESCEIEPCISEEMNDTIPIIRGSAKRKLIPSRRSLHLAATQPGALRRKDIPSSSEVQECVSRENTIQSVHLTLGAVADLKTEIQDIRMELRSAVDQLWKALRAVEEKAHQNSQRINGISFQKTEVKDVRSEIPIRTMEEFDAIEMKLKSAECQRGLREELCRLSADVYKTLDALLSNDIGKQFSWKGSTEKRCLKETRVGKVLLDALLPRMVTSHEKKAIILSIRRWLQNVQDRDGGRARRRRLSLQGNLLVASHQADITKKHPMNRSNEENEKHLEFHN